MDPYLEHPSDWPGTHLHLISATAGLLNAQLRPRGYYVCVEERVWLEDAGKAAYPDVTVVERRSPRTRPSGTLVGAEPVRIRIPEFEIHEGYLEVFDAKGKELVTGIEFVSPCNKAPGKGRELYRRKRHEWRKSGVHIVEIDLLRSGKHLLDVPLESLASLKPRDYLVNVVRAHSKEYEVNPIKVRDSLPNIWIPLKDGDEDAVLELQAVMNDAYGRGPYPDRLDYTSEPVPPLRIEDQAWADELLRQKGFRK